MLTHSGKPTSNDSDDPFAEIIGLTALQGVRDNLMLLAQSNGQTKLHTKGRLIFPSEKILNFENGKYSEKIRVGAEYEDKAPAQAEVLRLLETREMTVSEIATTLNKDRGQISNICSILSDARRIKRKSRNAPWEYVRQEVFT